MTRERARELLERAGRSSLPLIFHVTEDEKRWIGEQIPSDAPFTNTMADLIRRVAAQTEA